MHFKMVSHTDVVQDLLRVFDGDLLPVDDMGTHDRLSIHAFPSVKGADALINPRFGLSLLRVLLQYKERHNLDIFNKGFRFSVLFNQNDTPLLYIGHDNIAPIDPRDWIAREQPIWAPVQYDKPHFFAAVDQSAEKRENQVLFNGEKKNSLLYLPEGVDSPDTGIFAMEDGAPKALVHYLVLSRGLEGTFLDDSVTLVKWLNALAMAHQVVQLRPVDDIQSVRIVSNIGQGFQVAPVAHIHVQVDTSFGNLVPEEFGFPVKNGRIVFSSSEEEAAYKGLMDEYPPRSSQAGFREDLAKFKKY